MAALKIAFRMPQRQRVAPARRTELGEDGNQMKVDLSRRSDSALRNAVKTGAKAHGNSFPEFILGWTIGQFQMAKLLRTQRRMSALAALGSQTKQT